VDWKAEYSALSSTRSQKKKLKQPTPVPLVDLKLFYTQPLTVKSDRHMHVSFRLDNDNVETRRTVLPGGHACIRRGRVAATNK